MEPLSPWATLLSRCSRAQELQLLKPRTREPVLRNTGTTAMRNTGTATREQPLPLPRESLFSKEDPAQPKGNKIIFKRGFFRCFEVVKV